METNMRKKQMTVLGVIALFLTACAFSPADAVEPSEAMTEASEAMAEPSGTMAEAGGQEAEKGQDIQAKEIYEAFINEEYAGREGYTYAIYDGDGDGSKELYITWGSAQSFYIFTYTNGGLCIEYQKEFPVEFSELQWIDTETLTAAQDGEMEHSGIYVYVSGDETGERYWYPNETDFVAANGFEGAEPFFEYTIPNGQKRLTLYYDEVTQRGCGIRYYERDPSTFSTTGMYGFTFEGLGEIEESGIREDYLKPEPVEDVNYSGEVDDFKENTEYDDRGQITHYDAAGILTSLAEDNAEPQMILWIDYEYYDNGNLKSRSYWHNGYIFGTWYTTWNCFFDEQGRIAYEDIYITHGSWDTYYIYLDDTREPAYILDLDNCGDWIPKFRKGK